MIKNKFSPNEAEDLLRLHREIKKILQYMNLKNGFQN